MAPALAHRFIKCIAACRRAERRHIGLAEGAHRIGGELHFAHRHQIEGAQLARGALAFRIEGADRFQRVTKEIEAHRQRLARRPHIENAAAHRIFAGVAHRGRADETVDLEPIDQRIHAHRIARRGRKALLLEPAPRRHPLQQRVDRRAQHARLFGRRAAAGEARKNRHTPRGGGRIGRNAVIGLPIPGREFQHFDLRRGEGQSLHERPGSLAIARHMHQHGWCLAGRRRQGARQIGSDKSVETVGDAGEGNGSTAGKR